MRLRGSWAAFLTSIPRLREGNYIRDQYSARRMIKHDEIRLSQEDRCLRARYLGALADRVFRAECARLGLDVRIPTMPISRSSESRSFIPIDPDQCGVGAPLDAFLISVF